MDVLCYFFCIIGFGNGWYDNGEFVVFEVVDMVFFVDGVDQQLVKLEDQFVVYCVVECVVDVFKVVDVEKQQGVD